MTSLGCTEFFNWDVTGMPVVDSDVLWTPSWPRDVSGTMAFLVYANYVKYDVLGTASLPRDISGAMASLGCTDFCEVPCVCTSLGGQIS
jgi:hypothetical protein